MKLFERLEIKVDVFFLERKLMYLKGWKTHLTLYFFIKKCNIDLFG